MNIQQIDLYPYSIPLNSGGTRSGTFLMICDETGREGWGDVAPLPNWSRESLESCLEQLDRKRENIFSVTWTAQNIFDELARLELLPALAFGLESALLSVLAPLSDISVTTSALLMGPYDDILSQAKRKYEEGFSTAKLKVGHLGFDEAADLIEQLKGMFRLRIDVNRAWETSEALRFFARYPLGTFDYVEEPFRNPHDLPQFVHPLAVDESFPHDLSFDALEKIPSLKALIYKPTIQGGMVGCLPLYEWAKRRGIALVLSSSFESDLGIAHIASIAHRLSLTAPIGVGTYDSLKEHMCAPPLKFIGPQVHVQGMVIPNLSPSSTSEILAKLKWDDS